MQVEKTTTQHSTNYQVKSKTSNTGNVIDKASLSVLSDQLKNRKAISGADPKTDTHVINTDIVTKNVEKKMQEKQSELNFLTACEEGNLELVKQLQPSVNIECLEVKT